MLFKKLKLLTGLNNPPRKKMRTRHLTVDELTKFGLSHADFRENSYTLGRIDKYFAIFAPPLAQVIHLYDISEDKDGKFYPEVMYLGISYKGVNYEVYDSPSGRVSLGCTNEDLRRNTSKLILSELPDYRPEPPMIGKATEKKLNEWAEYLAWTTKKKIEFLEKIRVDIEAFRETIKGINFMHVNTYNSHETATARLNGIEYSYNINFENGYISQKVEIDYHVSNNARTFLLLSNNSYTPE